MVNVEKSSVYNLCLRGVRDVTTLSTDMPKHQKLTITSNRRRPSRIKDVAIA